MMRYSEWLEWLAQKWELELRDSILSLKGRAGHARAMTILHDNAPKTGKTFTIHFIPTVRL